MIYLGGRGARGSSGRGGGGEGLSAGDIVSTTSYMSERGRFDGDSMLQAFMDVAEDYGYTVEDIQVAELTGKGQSVLAFFDGENIAFNQSYLSDGVMDSAYDACVASGFHPGRGNKTGLQAVAAHELGHGLTEAVGAKMGLPALGASGKRRIDAAADAIVNEARKKTGDRGVVQMASKISKYATYSNAEAISEAFADVYCNGSKARKESRAIVSVVDSYLK